MSKMVSLIVLAVFLGTALCDVNEKLRLSQNRVSSDFQGLQTPLEGAAASPDQRRVISLHHNPEDENNLERLCNDPFHSFLCKPAGPRKRLDGRLRPGAKLPPGLVLPPGAQPAASNVEEQSQPLESGSALLSDSLPNERAYLPPENKPAPAIVEPAYLPPEVPTTQYLPVRQEPQPSNEQVLIIPQEPSRNYLPELNTADSTNLSPNIQGGALLADSIEPESREENHTLERLCNDPFHSFLCKPLKPRKRIDGNIRPEAKIPPNALVGASSIRREARVLPLESGSALLSSASGGNVLPTSKPQGYVYSRPANSFVYPSSQQGSTVYQTTQRTPQPGYNYNRPSTTARPLTSTYNPPTIKPFEPSPNPSNDQQNYASQSTSRPFSTIQPTVNTGYSYQKPFQQPSPFPTNNQGYSYEKSSNPFTYGSTTTTSRPIYQSTSRPFVQNANPTNIQQSFVKPVQSGYNYDRPSRPFDYPTTTTRPTAFPIFQSTRPTRPSYNGEQNPYPSNEQPSVIKPSNGYNYPKPTNTFTYSTTTTPKPIIQFANPTNVQQNVIPNQNGYNYQRPSVPFTYAPQTQRPTFPTTPSTTSRPVYQSTSVPSQDYQFPNPSNVQQSFVKPGYNYDRPKQPFTYTTPRPTFPTTTYQTTTTQRPFIQFQQPTNNQGTYVSTGQNGYSYQKPQITFSTTSRPQTTTQVYQQSTQSSYNYFKPQSTFQTVRPTTFYSPTVAPTARPTVAADNQYQRPSNVQDSFSKPNGYNYQRPQNPFTLPTTRPTTVADYQYQRPSNVQENVVRPNGYNYQRPQTSFTLPTTQRPTSVFTTARPTTVADYEYQRPSNVQENVVRPNGYNYQRPQTPFTYPTTQRPTSIFTTTTARPTTAADAVYQRPSNVQENVVRPNGYNYQRPQTPFTLPTTQRPASIYTTTSRPSTTASDYVYQRPSNVQENVVRPNGYNYQRPQTPFTLPTTQRPTSIYTTVRPSTTFATTASDVYQRPSNVQENVVKPNGYNYQRPQTPFTIPTTQRPTSIYTTVRPSTTFATTVSDVYQRPSDVQENVVRPGYNYQKPQTPFTLPTQRPTTYFTTTTRPTTFPTTASDVYQRPSDVQENVIIPGYNYQKPQTPFTLPTQRPTTYLTTTTRPTTFATTSDVYQRPSNNQENVAKPNGYNYQRPQTPFNLPTQNDYQNQRPTNVQENFVRPNQNGYNYQKPDTTFSYPSTTSASVTSASPQYNYPGSNVQQNRPDDGQYQQPTIQQTIQQGYNYNKPQTPFNPFSTNGQDGYSYPKPQNFARGLKFGDRINPRIPTIHSVPNNHLQHDDFQPLRNFEII